jgi:hypothetical protein
VPSYYVAASDEVAGIVFGPQSDVRFYAAHRVR